MRFTVALRFIAVGVLVALVLSYGSVHVLQSDRPIGYLLVSADGLTLAGTEEGCYNGRLEVQESDDWVAVWLHAYPVVTLPGECAMESFQATLRRPLGNRLLVDGKTREVVRSFNGSGILRPARLPDGFVHRYDTASFPDENVVAPDLAGCVQLYTEPDGFDQALWISQVPGGRWKPPDGVTPQPISVRGYPGYAIPGEIVWTERGQLVTVESRAYAYAVLSTAQLLDIAENLR